MADTPTPRWSLRTALIAVSNLERSVAFYTEIGPFEEFARDDAVVILGTADPFGMVLILREARTMHVSRHGQQSLGLRAITFNVGSTAELDRVEGILRSRSAFAPRRTVGDDASDLLLGRDPDNLPLAFVRYAEGAPPGPDYYRRITEFVYSLDT
jgi:hypothetical protein